MAESVTTLFRIRVVATFNAGNKEITSDLSSLHQAHYEVVAFQPGNPGSSALGSFTIKLHPPGSEGYAAAKPIYDALDYFQRVELYGSADGASLGKLYYAGIITEIRRTYGENATFELSGVSDLGLLNLSTPFPGELSPNVISPGDYNQAHAYFGTNEAGWMDNFTPFTPGNYTSTHTVGGSTGTWASTTDDGLNVVTCSTGNGAALLAKTSASTNDGAGTMFLEVSGRLLPSSDTTNAGTFGIGWSASSANCNDSWLAYVTAHFNSTSGHWDLDVSNAGYSGGTLFGTVQTTTNVRTSVDDPEGYITITIGIFYMTSTGWAVTVNGTKVQNSLVFNGPSLSPAFPFLTFGKPNAGTAHTYMTNLIHMTRYSDDGNPGTALIKQGTVGTSLHTLPFYGDAGPTFLEFISRTATREGFYWRYTPSPYVVGARPLGTMDYTNDPGTDYGTNQTIVFSQGIGNLINVALTANADQFASGTMTAGPPGTDGGGLAFWRDVSSISKYGVIQDQVLAATLPTFSELRRGAYRIQSNRLNLSSAGSKTIKVLRDPQTADKWRELDRVMLHCPELGLNYLVARVIGYTFDENNPVQTLTLDQFSTDDPNLLSKRMQTSVWQAVAKFNAR